MIDFSIELMLSAVGWLLLASWRALPLFLLVFIFNYATRRTVAPRFHCLLWGIVLVRLVLPFSIESPFSMQQQTMTLLGSVGFVTKSSVGEDVRDEFYVGDSAAEAQTWTAWEPSDLGADTGALPASGVVKSDEAALPFYNLLEIILLMAAVAWLIGTAVLMLRSGIRYVRFSRRLSRCELVEDQRVIDLILRTCDKLSLGKRPQIKLVPELGVPSIFGIVRPTICLPASALQLADKDLQTIFAHEVAHAKRRDALFLLLAEFVRAVHWVNPMAWLTYSRLQDAIEQAADQKVIRSQIPNGPKDYAQLLLKFSAAPKHAFDGAATGLLFSATAKKLKWRVELIHRKQSRSSWLTSGLALAAIVGLSLTGLTDSQASAVAITEKQINIPKFSEAFVAPSAIALRSSEQMPQDDLVSGTYDITKALSRVRELNDIDDPVSALQDWLMPLELMNAANQEWVQRGELSIKGTSLQVRAPATAHQSIKRQIELVEQAGLCQVLLQWHVIQCPIELVKKFDLHWAAHLGPRTQGIEQALNGSPSVKLNIEEIDGFSQRTLVPSSPPILSAQVSKLAMQTLIEECQADARANVMQLPRVTLFNGQTASVHDECYRPFVTNVNPGDDATDLEPIVDVFAEGLRIDFCADVKFQDRTSLRCRFLRSNILDVHMANLPLGDLDQTVTVQVPRAIQDETKLQCNLGETDGILVACPVPFSSEETKGPAVIRLFWVTAEIFREFD